MRDARTKQRMAEEELREATPIKCLPTRAPVQPRAPVSPDRPIELLQRAVVRRESGVLGEHHERDPRGIVGTAGLDTALSVQRQLLPKKQILGRQLRPRSEAEQHEPEGVEQQPNGRLRHDR